MTQASNQKGSALVRHLEEAPSYWQPVPANGYVTCIVSSEEVASDTRFGAGRQTIAPGGCYVRTHDHPAHDEVIHFIEGTGRVELDDGAQVFRAEPGTTVFVGKGRRHSFVNDSSAPLTFFWLLMPCGLEPFFQAIGRPRQPGEPAPEPFARPDDVEAIEARTVFSTKSNHGA